MSHHNIDNVESLLTRIRQGFRPKFLFFWGHQSRQDGRIDKHCLSQWWAVSFTVDGIVYPSTEHYMMAEKARLFGDHETCEKIRLALHPAVAKKLGRTVRNFAEETWSRHRFAIVVRGNEAKFLQNEALKDFLVQTKERILVEASPVDRIWGIGLAEDAPEAKNPQQWRGLNLLGFALMQVRSRLFADPVL